MTKPLDEQLVAALCRNGRADIRDLANSTSEVPTTVQKRLRALEDSGTISGYTAMIDYGKLGYETVIFRLAVELGQIDSVTARLSARTPFMTVYQMSDTDTVFAVGKFKTESAIASCLSELHDDLDIRGIETNRVRSIHREGSSPLING